MICAAQTRKFSHLLQAGRAVAFDFAHHGHALVTLYVQFYALIGQNLTGEFTRKMYAAYWILFTLFSVYFDSWGWQSFVSTCDVFNCLFPLDVQNEIQLLSGVFCYSWLACLLDFRLRNTLLVKAGNPISDGIVFVFTFLDAYEGWKVWSDTGVTWYLLGAASRMVSLSNYSTWCLFLHLI